MSVLLRAIGVALVSLVAISILGGIGSGLKSFVKIAACVLLFSLAVSELSQGVDAIKDAYLGIKSENEFLGESISVMIKALAIALVGRVGADICKECGEGGLAQGIESVSGVMIFTLSLPIVTSILEFASDILQRGG